MPRKKCLICFEPPRCEHFYHHHCIDKWRELHYDWNGRCFFCTKSLLSDSTVLEHDGGRRNVNVPMDDIRAVVCYTMGCLLFLSVMTLLQQCMVRYGEYHRNVVRECITTGESTVRNCLQGELSAHQRYIQYATSCNTCRNELGSLHPLPCVTEDEISHADYHFASHQIRLLENRCEYLCHLANPDLYYTASWYFRDMWSWLLLVHQ